jgi:hypothetical protein
MGDLTRVIKAMREAKEDNTAIATDAARIIASWYQSPGQDGIAFAQFASTGQLPPRRDMEAAITREQRAMRAESLPARGSVEYSALSALRHYIRNPRLRPKD